jgi:protein SCO1/2
VCDVRSRLLVTAAMLAVLPLAGCGDTASSQEGPVANVSVHDADGLANGIVLPTPYAAAHVSLEDTAGKPYDLATDAAKPLTLVFFGYTNCPDICQVVMANIAAALVRLQPAERSQVGMVFVTTDPKRDTASVLRRYLDRFDPSFGGATGSIAAIVRAGKAFDIPIEKGQRLATGGYDVTHGTNVVGLRPDGTAPYVWTQGTTPGGLADDIRTILQGKVGHR